jgi:uncharacterized repeat protein (TIGR01451 family)
MRLARPLAALATVTILVASCEPSRSTSAIGAPEYQLEGPLPRPGSGVATPENFQVCKSGSSTTFTYVIQDRTVNPIQVTNGSVSENDGDCEIVAAVGSKGGIVNVTENIPPGFQLKDIIKVVVTGTSSGGVITSLHYDTTIVPGPSVIDSFAGSSAPGGFRGVLVKYENIPLPPTGEIGDFVWSDLNGNGIQDAGEPGIGGQTVTLTGPVTASTTTNGSGQYLFSGLPAGNYTVTVGTPAGFTVTPSVQGTDTTIDSNGSPAGVTLATSSSSNLTIDFGFVPIPPAQLSVNKTPDNGSFAQNGQASFTIVVSNTGTGLAATNVALTDVLPGNGGLVWQTATASQGSCSLSSNNLSCSLGTLAAGASATVTVSSTTTTPLAACTLQPNPAAIATADGPLTAQDAGSLSCTPAPAQLKVVKTPDNGTFTQGSQVSYNIIVSNPGTGLAANNVQLGDALPGNGGLVWQTATTTQGSCSITSNALSCSLGSIAAGASATVTVSSTTTTPNAACTSQPNPAAIATATGGLTAQDAGSLSCTPPPPTGQIGDFVWKDTDGDGIQDAGEPGIAGLTVTLTGPVSATTTTSASGKYLFSNLPAGTYTVSVGTPSGLTPTLTGAGTAATDNNGSPATVTLPTSSSIDLTIDFGFKVLVLPPTTVTVCKIGTSAQFTLGSSSSGGSGGGGSYNPWGNGGSSGGGYGGSSNNSFTLQDGGCKVVDTHVIGTSATTVTVTENVASNTVLDSIVITNASGTQKVTGKTSVNVSSSDAGNANVTFYNHLIPPHHGGHGCTSGYYQDSNHHGAYTGGYSPHTQFSSVFGGNAYQGKTLDDVLHFSSRSGQDALAREAVAAFLNAQNNDVGYNMSTGQVIRTFNSAWGSRNYDQARQQFESWNTDNDDQ